jgi:aquaporin NIP
MDVSLSIPSAPAASMLVDRDNMSDDKISIFIPRSPSNKIQTLGFQQNEASDDPPPVSAKSMTLALIKKVMTSANPELTKPLVTTTVFNFRYLQSMIIPIC